MSRQIRFSFPEPKEIIKAADAVVEEVVVEEPKTFNFHITYAERKKAQDRFLNKEELNGMAELDPTPEELNSDKEYNAFDEEPVDLPDDYDGEEHKALDIEIIDMTEASDFDMAYAESDIDGLIEASYFTPADVESIEFHDDHIYIKSRNEDVIHSGNYEYIESNGVHTLHPYYDMSSEYNEEDEVVEEVLSKDEKLRAQGWSDEKIQAYHKAKGDL